MDTHHIDVSIVIPIYNEAESLHLLYERLCLLLDRWERSCEVFFVDDGSRDGSVEILRELYTMQHVLFKSLVFLG
ncbi:glycosyltransferase [Chloroflexi bacterium TSY]|nr:glycosyltransferase [Chloroflexi bacterium TSY]MBV7338383.1 glycosyltransferase [Chloroflexi bacterium TSY]